MIEVAGISIGVLQLNTAWAAGQDNELLAGEAQVRQALDEAADAFLRIALVHHPLEDLAEVDRVRLRSLLGSPGGVHFLLRGHLHHPSTVVGTSPDGELVELAAGATYLGGKWPRTCLLTELDLAAGKARTLFYRYGDTGAGFWAPDTLAYQGAPDGTWTFDLPKRLLVCEDEAPEIPVMTGARRATVTARYRAAAAAVHGTVRFIGFADAKPRRNIGVPELFVPLRFEPRGDGQEN